MLRQEQQHGIEQRLGVGKLLEGRREDGSWGRGPLDRKRHGQPEAMAGHEPYGVAGPAPRPLENGQGAPAERRAVAGERQDSEIRLKRDGGAACDDAAGRGAVAEPKQDDAAVSPFGRGGGWIAHLPLCVAASTVLPCVFCRPPAFAN